MHRNHKGNGYRFEFTIIHSHQLYDITVKSVIMTTFNSNSVNNSEFNALAEFGINNASDLIGAAFQWGSDPTIIETEEDAERIYNTLVPCHNIQEVIPSECGEYDCNEDFEQLGIDSADKYYMFVKDCYGSFALADDIHIF